MEQDEILDAAIPQICEIEASHDSIEQIKIAPVEGINHRIIILWKEVANVEA